MSCGEKGLYSFLVGMGLLWAFFMGALASDSCHGTWTGGNQSMRICRQEAWGFLPLGIAVALLPALLLALRCIRVSVLRLMAVTCYMLYVVISPVWILNLPFLTERLE